MIDLNKARDLIEKKIEAIQFSESPYQLYEPVAYIMSLGGKRLRPAMVLMGYNLFSQDYEKAIEPALGIELFHNFTLLHDDIMDKADMRRGKLTVHKKWNENTAILSGDAMCIMAYKYICKSEPQYLANVLQLFNKTALEVCEGQQYDMNFESYADVSTSEYLKMIELKTSVLLAASLNMGAILAGAGEDDCKNLYEFGRLSGIAFQLRDDYLDVFGDPNVFGKKRGGDILANKKTYLLIRAFEKADEEDREKLHSLLEEKNENTKINSIINLYEKLNIAALTEEKTLEFMEASFNALNQTNVDEAKKDVLKELVEVFVKRTH